MQYVIFFLTVDLLAHDTDADRSLFRGTVIENISLRRRGVTEADVLQVCQRVCLLKPLQV